MGKLPNGFDLGLELVYLDYKQNDHDNHYNTVVIMILIIIHIYILGLAPSQ